VWGARGDVGEPDDGERCCRQGQRGTELRQQGALVGPLMGKRESRPWVVSDELWSLIKPLLFQAGSEAGRRQAWEYLPQELGFGSGMTCWRRLAATAGGRCPSRLTDVLRMADGRSAPPGGCLV
jgi:hypothetical protein